jgi:hypothetical protein
MEAKNFRIGNLVEEPKGCTHKIERVDELSTRVRHGLKISIPHITGFGFIERPMSYDIELNEHTILQLSICNDKGKGEYYAMIRQEDEMISVPKRIFYVHELQNLFFALTGTELEMKVERSTCG